jgi:hypothetical protein
VPGAEPLGFVEADEKRLGLGVLQRQDRELLASVDPRDDTRHEAAKASAAVIEKDGSA